MPWLEEGESTVGLELEVRHLAPTPLGDSVACQARVKPGGTVLLAEGLYPSLAENSRF